MQEECLNGFENTHTRVKIIMFGLQTLIYWELKCFSPVSFQGEMKRGRELSARRSSQGKWQKSISKRACTYTLYM
jgi:hypothetical protein